MKEATLIYPHQLFTDSPAIKAGRAIFLIEEPLLLTHNPIHRQKLQLHKLSMDAYQNDLESAGHKVHRIRIQDYATSDMVLSYIAKQGVQQIHVIDTTDNYLELALERSGLHRVWYDSPLFILTKADALERFKKSKKHMTAFYKQLRLDHQILLESDDSPTGGKWSFDDENRKKIPKDTTIPKDIAHFGNSQTTESEQWITTVAAEQYGETGCWLPYTNAGAAAYLQTFLTERFASFGTHEDAITTKDTRLWHSTLSPLLNIGLLTPQQVLASAITHAAEHKIPLNSLEGFVRQIIGWREFVRASYECDGSRMRTKNFWQHTRTLPETFWSASTGVLPLDNAIEKALTHGYNHHIERLMVLGNFMLLTQTEPNEVYKWFMSMYLDAYDWVMVPNVYGMSQFADGGSFATKPYISGSNYLKKMSNYPTGEWEGLWTALYWNFISKHTSFFTANHRLSMMPRLLGKMPPETRKAHLDTAAAFFKKT